MSRNRLPDLGITQFDETPPELTDGLLPFITFVEYRIGSVEEIDRCRTSAKGCIVHAPDSEDENFLSVVAAAAEVPSVFAVNTHARPDDEEWLCCNCSRREISSNKVVAPCPHCGEPEPARWRGTFTFSDACQRLREAVGMLEARGKSLLIENTCESPALMARILAAVPSAGFTLDTGHSILYGEGPVSYLERSGSRLRHLHLHDNLGGDSERYHDLHLPPGQGIVDWERLAIELRNRKYSGTSVFECIPDPQWVRWWLQASRPTA